MVSCQALSRERKVDGNYVDVGVDANEMGPKDTVRVDPKKRVHALAKFDGAAGISGDELMPFHCHILEHENLDMMRAFKLKRI